MSTVRYALACIFLVWYVVVLVFAYNGFWEIMLKFRYRLNRQQRRKNTDALESVSSSSFDGVEGVSIIRPLKGVDPEMSSCLESSFVQDYPTDKFEILFCVDDPEDSCIPIVKNLIEKHPLVNARILLSSNYNRETRTSDDHYGPNPKVNNLAKGFLEAKFDIIWAMDSNVWAPSRVLARSVKSLQQNIDNGRPVRGKRQVKLVHHTPLALSVVDTEYSLSPISSSGEDEGVSTDAARKCGGVHRRILKKSGAKLDEMFLFTSHSKFYVTFNNLSIAPCVNGKSNIYRRSDLDYAVSQIPKVTDSQFFYSPDVLQDAKYFTSLGPGHAIKFFSRYIGEDNMIGICLWENAMGRTGMTGDVVVQPLSGEDNGVNDYMERRVRWLRVRKYMVLAATLLEPTTESILCGLYGNFAISTLFLGAKSIFNWKLFMFHMTVWIITDYIQFYVLLNSALHSDVNLPAWLKKQESPTVQKSVARWFTAWLGRELLALPIWIQAMIGHEIDWRGRPFKIKQDLTAEEL
ncbi:ceramide glucosyltransferase [[Candida] railenensis]|uniref:Ceramide glucosyltransferase n=1 Tax=[Candida] railenensis TaxID=45579 RepID=A0A9P0QNN0_9ASCO|nr:ceramide glucosyltransferase [[Candida] railenensis]